MPQMIRIPPRNLGGPSLYVQPLRLRVLAIFWQNTSLQEPKFTGSIGRATHCSILGMQEEELCKLPHTDIC